VLSVACGRYSITVSANASSVREGSAAIATGSPALSAIVRVGEASGRTTVRNCLIITRRCKETTSPSFVVLGDRKRFCNEVTTSFDHSTLNEVSGSSNGMSFFISRDDNDWTGDL